MTENVKPSGQIHKKLSHLQQIPDSREHAVRHAKAFVDTLMNVGSQINGLCNGINLVKQIEFDIRGRRKTDKNETPDPLERGR